MLVSFCVIAYNEEKALTSLFEDIKAQSFPHNQMEVVLVNSMSSDNTRMFMEKFAQQNIEFSRVIVTDNPKKIQAAGWNKAIETAKGDIIIRVDAHTHIPKDFVKKSVACIQNGEDVCGGPRPNVSEEKTPWQNTLLIAEKSMFGSSIALFRRANHKTYVKTVFHGTYKREVFERVGLFNENLGRTEDNEMHYRINKAGYKICYTPDIISYQHIRSTWRGMLRQKFLNGYWIGLTVGVCPGCLSAYHFVPLCFLVTLLGTIFAAVKGTFWPLAVMAVVYAGVNVLMSVLAALKEMKHIQYFFLPFIFLSLHLSYGVGTLVGIIKMPFWKKKLSKKEKED